MYNDLSAGLRDPQSSTAAELYPLNSNPCWAAVHAICVAILRLIDHQGTKQLGYYPCYEYLTNVNTKSSDAKTSPPKLCVSTPQD